ncbi:hypothetical protein L6164_034324 [Bauhinia variegata]|uniref:Uncharacterized protein n=1 Tax=Bauhinia variegata TaxID=167791 RepID=A0ACB9KV73_BAUVA|nr:hypothetical protein L6164_034324 [Bauhinia variegata]
MVHKAPQKLLLLILLGFSFFLLSAAVPTTRSLLSNREESSVQTTQIQVDLDFTNGEEMFDMGKEFIVEGRMDMESADYPGTGANNRHEPKTPGRA